MVKEIMLKRTKDMEDTNKLNPDKVRTYVILQRKNQGIYVKYKGLNQ